MFPGGGPRGGHPRQWDWLGREHRSSKVQMLRRQRQALDSGRTQSAAGAGVGTRLKGHLSRKAEGIASSLRSESGRAENRPWSCHSGSSFLLPIPSSSTLRPLYTHPSSLHQTVAKILL